MHSKKIFLVTFPIDLGNRTLEANLHLIFKNDMEFYRFAPKILNTAGADKVSLFKSILYRFSSAIALRREISKQIKAGKKIVFHGISPALFSFGTWRTDDTAIILDWTRALYPVALGQNPKKGLAFMIHKKILKSCNKILCLTESVRKNLKDIYKIDNKFLYSIPAPFLLDKLDIAPRATPAKPRVLFVGGDLQRKGGDILLKAWHAGLKDKCYLTMMTNQNLENSNGLNILPGIKYGSLAHRKVFEENDILILPTRLDSYPQVIGEAAAAGLAVITTKFALGACEVIENGESGYIAETPEDAILFLENLCLDISLIDQFKNKGYELMQKRFSTQVIRATYLQILN